MGNRILNATKRPLGVTVDVQSDYSHIKLTELRECFNIWTTVINEKERLDQNEFDEVFGLMLGDGEGHFSVMSHGMIQFDYDPVPKCDAMVVFLALSSIGRSSIKQHLSKRALMLDRIASMYYFLTKDDAPDRGITKSEVKSFITKTLSGLCRLTGRPQPDAKLLFKLTKQVIDERKKSNSATVTRKHILDWLSGSRDAMTFYDKCIEEIVGRGFDDFSADILSSALFQTEEEETLELKNSDYQVKGILGIMKVSQLVKSGTWDRKLFLTSKSTCVDALRMLQKNKTSYVPMILTDEIYNIPLYDAEIDDEDNEVIEDIPYPKCIGIVDYKKLIISFLRVLSLNNVELPSEIHEKDEVATKNLAEAKESAIDDTNKRKTKEDNDNDEKESSQSQQVDLTNNKLPQISYEEIIRKISSVITTIGRTWSNIKLNEIIPQNNSSSDLASSSMESDETTEATSIYYIYTALQALCEPLIKVVPEQPIYQLLEILSNPKVDRVPLIQSPRNNHSFLTVIDDMSVLKHLLSQEYQVWGDILWANINRLGLIRKDFVQVSLETTAIVSFHQMLVDSPISTVAVVDNQGVLISTLTDSDFSCLTKHFLDNANVINAEFGDLVLPTIDFYSAHKIPTITINTLFIDALKLMVSNDLTDLFVVDELNKPIGYLNIKNIFKLTLRLHMN